MRAFEISQRDNLMTPVVSYRGVAPVPRGIAFALYHIERHGGMIDLFSGDRTPSVVKDHNKSFHTNLHSQLYLYTNQWRKGFNPANSPLKTSHCYKSDGNPAYRVNGKQIRSMGSLPWYMLGLDLADKGKYQDVSHFLQVAHRLGYKVVQPYKTGSELHHVNFVESPIPVLEKYSVISKQRG